MHTILVPVDGSDHAMKALRIACDLAEKYGGRIVLLYVLGKGKQARDLLALKIATAFGAQLKAILEKADAANLGPVPDKILTMVGEKVLEQATTKVERLGLEVLALPITSGDPAEVILAMQKKIAANTIVMGSRGIAGSSAASFGSVSQKVFSQAPCTCLSVK